MSDFLNPVFPVCRIDVLPDTSVTFCIRSVFESKHFSARKDWSVSAKTILYNIVLVFFCVNVFVIYVKFLVLKERMSFVFLQYARARTSGTMWPTCSRLKTALWSKAIWKSYSCSGPNLRISEASAFPIWWWSLITCYCSECMAWRASVTSSPT